MPSERKRDSAFFVSDVENCADEVAIKAGEYSRPEAFLRAVSKRLRELACDVAEMGRDNAE